MLQSIRDRTQGWIAGVIISILILSFALWGIHSYMIGGGGDIDAAKVNGVEITKAQLSAAYERMRRQMQAQLGPDSLDTETNLKAHALQTLISVEVLKQGALAEGYRISSPQIDNFILRIPEFQVNGQFSEERFRQLLNVSLFSSNEFMELIRTGLLTEQPRLGVILTSFALPNEVTDTVALIDQVRKIQYVIVPRSIIDKNSIEISDDKIHAYYQHHQDEFKTPEKVSVDYVELSVKDLMASQHVGDKDLASFYHENIASYTEPKQWKVMKIIVPLAENASDQETKAANSKVQDILQKIKQGTRFSVLARELSTEKKSTNKSLEWITLAAAPVDWQKALSTLTRLGQISEPIHTSDGIVLLKVEDIKEPVVKPFHKVKEKVRMAIAHQQAVEKFADLREKFANAAYEHPDSLQAAADTLELKVQTSELFTRNSGNDDDDMTANKKFREAAFSNDVLNSQNNSDVIQVGPESVVVLRVKSHVPAALMPLKTVQKQIVDKLTASELDARVQQRAKEIKQKLQQPGADPQQVALDYHLNLQNTDFVGRNSSNKVNSAILYAAFRIPRHQASAKNFYTIVKVPEGFAIVTSLAERNGSFDANQQEVFAEQVQNSQGLLEYGLYKQSLMDRAKIVVES